MENSALNRLFKRLQSKMTSQSGASITYALLLFLVCAVVSSVILAAGTAAAGRMSQSVESDQRYYAVSSAVELIKDLLDGQTYSEKTVTTTFVSGETTKTTTLGVGINSSDLLAVLGKKALEWEENPASGFSSDSSSAFSSAFTLAVDGNADLKVTIIPTITSSGSDGSSSPVLDLKICNSDSNNPLTYSLIFTGDIKERTGKEGTTKDVMVKKVTWNYYSIKTVQAAATSSSPLSSP